MSEITREQVATMMEHGFTHGFVGYPLLWSENGKVTIVDEQARDLFVWEFHTDGTFARRSYKKVGGDNSDLSTER